MYYLYYIVLHIRGSHFCAAIVQVYHMYSLYYLVLRVSSDLCAVYFHYFAAPTQIFRALAAPTQLVQAITSHRPPPFKSQRWRSRSGVNGGAPIPAPMVALPFRGLLTSFHPTPVPPTSHPVHPSHPASNQPAHKSQCFLIRSSRYNTIQLIRKYNPASISSDQKDPSKTHT